MYDLVKSKLDSGFLVGAGTVSNRVKNLIQGHAYAVLGVYNVRLDNGGMQKLI
jgi:hypothetical protein